MANRKKKEQVAPATTPVENEQNEPSQSFPIQINIIQQTDDGNVELEVNYSNEFREWFMEEQGLKRWSEKRFQQVVGPLLQEYYDNLAAQQREAQAAQPTPPANPES